MANYDYKCPKCGIIEIQHSIKEDAMKKCPQCGSLEFYRTIGSNVGIKFNGSGFFVNDYKKVDSNLKKYLPREEGTKKFY